jgi:uncharacterized protein (DUF1778 family)
MNSVLAKEARLVARVSADVQALIKHAAELSGATLSQFMIEAATVKAHAVIETVKNIQLTVEGANTIFQALESPPEPNQALLEAAIKFKHNKGFYVVGDANTR